MTLGKKLQLLRRRNGLSQEQLADRLNVSRQAISKWELDAALPDTANVIALSRLFDVSADYLLKEDMEAPVEGAPKAVGQAAGGNHMRRRGRAGTGRNIHYFPVRTGHDTQRGVRRRRDVDHMGQHGYRHRPHAVYQSIQASRPAGIIRGAHRRGHTACNLRALAAKAEKIRRLSHMRAVPFSSSKSPVFSMREENAEIRARRDEIPDWRYSF